MCLKIYDFVLQSYVFVDASIVYWSDGLLTVCRIGEDSDRFRCSRRQWRKIQFMMWAGSVYIDISRLRHVAE